MKKLIFIIFVVFLSNCEGPVGPNGKDGINGIDGEDGRNGSYDKQIRIVFPFEYYLTESSVWEISEPNTYLTRFNKTSYLDVDSILFVVSMLSDWHKESTTDTSFVELYNITDSISIENTRLSVVSGRYKYLETNNIYENLPPYEITIGLRMRKTDNSGWSYISTPQLLLYRK